MPYLFDRKQRAVFFKKEDTLAALESGKYGYTTRPDAKVSVVGPNGESGTIPSKSVLDALRMGWSIEEDQEKYIREAKAKYGGAPHRAWAAGTINSLALGLGDAILSKTGLVSKEELVGLKAAHPTASLMGELTGIVGPALASGGAALGARGAAKAGGSQIANGLSLVSNVVPAQAAANMGARTIEYALAKVALKEVGKSGAGNALRGAASRGLVYGAVGATEGGLYGAGRGVSEYTLGNSENAAEIVASGALTGVVTGAVGGGIFGSAGYLGGSMLKGAANKMSSALKWGANKLDDPVAKEAKKYDLLAQTMGWSKADMAKIPSEKVKRIEKILFADDALPDGPIILGGKQTAENIRERYLDSLKHHGGTIGNLLDGADDFITHTNTATSLVNPKTAPLLQAFKKEIAENSASKHIPETKSFLKNISGQLDELSKKENITFKEAQKIKESYRGWGGKGKSPLEKSYKNFEKIIGEEMDTSMGRLSDLITKMPDEILDAYPIPASINSKLPKNELIKAIPQTYSRAKQVYGTLIRNAPQKDLPLAYYKIPVEKGLTAGARSVGWGIMYNSSLSRLLLRGVAGFGSETVKSVMATRGAIKGAEQASENLLKYHNAGKYGATVTAMEKVQSRINRAVNNFLKIKSPVEEKAFDIKIRARVPEKITTVLTTITKEKDRQKAAEQYANKLAEQISDPQKMADTISANLHGLGEVSSEVEELAAIKLANNMQYLFSQAPKIMSAPSLQPLLDETKINPDELANFERAVAVASNPAMVIEALTNGTLTTGLVKHLKALYPGLFEAMRANIATKAAEMDRKLNYTERKKLSLLFEIPLDISLTPDYIRRSQQAYINSKQSQQEKTGKGQSGISFKGTGKLSEQGDAYLSKSQRVTRSTQS